MRTVKFLTLGCKVNQYDTQSIRERFENAGFKEIDSGQKADIYLINTCTVTQRADAKSLKFIRRVKGESPEAKIVVTGCLTELDQDRIKQIDDMILIVRNRDKERVLDYLTLNEITRQRDNETTKNEITYFKGHTRAFLKIQDGCDNFCAYCKVPLVRGMPRSKPLNEVISEVENLVKNGFKEIVLCGICLGLYGKDLNPQISLFNVIEALEKIEEFLRIRLSSIEAGDVTDELIEKMSKSKKLCPHLHIPIQSGDDEILKKMNRKYRSSDYLELIKKIRNKIPKIAITTDVLVSFPAESESNFQNTLELVKEVLPLKVHIFPYSRREGTPAASNFKDEIAPAIIKERILRLKNLANTCALTYKKQFLNKKMDVLIEGRVKNNLNFWEGYTDNYIKVIAKSELNLKNQIMPFRLKKIVEDCIAVDFC